MIPRRTVYEKEIWISGKEGEWYRIRVKMSGFFEGECMGHSPGDEPLTLTKYYSCGLLQLNKPVGGNLSVAEPTA